MICIAKSNADFSNFMWMHSREELKDKNFASIVNKKSVLRGFYCSKLYFTYFINLVITIIIIIIVDLMYY